MATEISSETLSAHDEILSYVESYVFGLQVLNSVVPEGKKERELWSSLFSLFVDLLEQNVHDLRTWDCAVCKGHDFVV